MRIYSCSVVLVLIGFVWSTAVAEAQDWQGLRGAGDGEFSPKSLLSTEENVRLTVRWKKSVGSGYSSVVVADGRVVVMHADGEDDAIACLDVRNGAQLWKVSVGPTFKGANGSFDGPLSTPVVFDGKAFGLSARGRLVSVDLRSGDLNWQRELAKEEEAPLPLYGFTTSPIVVKDTLVLQLGAKGKLLVGLDPSTGETKWSGGDDRVASQTPMVFELNGRELILASGGKKLTAIDPENGSVLFETPHGGGNGSSVTPVALGGGRVLLTIDDSFSSAFDLKSTGNGVSVAPAWKERSIKNTYNIPVLYSDSVFGFSTRFLTCVDTKTGKARWKNRKPGDGFLAIIDGHLIITTKEGGLHIAEASPSRYEEVASVKVFDKLNWSLPAYSDNAIFMRSFGEVARVDITSGESSMAMSDEPPLPQGARFSAFLRRVGMAESASAKSQVVDEFMKVQESFPVTEDDKVYFLYRGDCQDAAVACDVFGARQERKMVRVQGTDLHYYSLQLPENQRANYVFLIDYKVEPDRLNPRQTVSSMYAGEMEFAVRLSDEEPLKMSWFAMPKWQAPAHLAALAGPLAGAIESHEVQSDKVVLPIDVYLPPGYSTKLEERFPVVYIQDGTAAQKLGQLAKAAGHIYSDDNADGPAPAILVFLKRPTNPMTRLANPSKSIVDHVVPFVDKTYRTVPNRSGRAVYGTGFNCANALGLAGGNPTVFSAVSAQSPLVFDQGQEQIIKLYQGIEEPLRVYIEWGSFDMFNPHENWDIRDIGQKLATEIAKNKKLEVRAQQVNDSTDWLSWQVRLGSVLEFLCGRK